MMAQKPSARECMYAVKCSGVVVPQRSASFCRLSSVSSIKSRTQSSTSATSAAGDVHVITSVSQQEVVTSPHTCLTSTAASTPACRSCSSRASNCCCATSCLQTSVSAGSCPDDAAELCVSCPPASSANSSDRGRARQEIDLTLTAGAAVVDDIQRHLQDILGIIRPTDSLRMAVRLEGIHPASVRTRYLTIVACGQSNHNHNHNHNASVQLQQQCCVLGIDCCTGRGASVGLVRQLNTDTNVSLDGEGGIVIQDGCVSRTFKPVSIQAMWTTLQMLHRCRGVAPLLPACNTTTTAATNDGVLDAGLYYEQRVDSSQSCINEWNTMCDVLRPRPPSPDCLPRRPSDQEHTESAICAALREIMVQVDLDRITTRELHVRLCQHLRWPNEQQLRAHKTFIDNEILVVFGQLERATCVLPRVFLGSEWNACDLEQLKKNNVGYVLNMTREVDNFFPGRFRYMNVRVLDEESTDLLRHWDDTFKFIDQARREGVGVLVHCRMGISRSAAVVLAYLMKSQALNYEHAWHHVKQRRPCVRPNAGFIKQLEIYQGILDASKQRHKWLCRSKSESNLKRGLSDASRSGVGGAASRLRRSAAINDHDTTPPPSQTDTASSPSAGQISPIVPTELIDAGTAQGSHVPPASPLSPCNTSAAYASSPATASDGTTSSPGPSNLPTSSCVGVATVCDEPRPKSWSPDQHATNCLISSIDDVAVPCSSSARVDDTSSAAAAVAVLDASSACLAAPHTPPAPPVPEKSLKSGASDSTASRLHGWRCKFMSRKRACPAVSCSPPTSPQDEVTSSPCEPASSTRLVPYNGQEYSVSQNQALNLSLSLDSPPRTPSPRRFGPPFVGWTPPSGDYFTADRPSSTVRAVVGDCERAGDDSEFPCVAGPHPAVEPVSVECFNRHVAACWTDSVSVSSSCEEDSVFSSRLPPACSPSSRNCTVADTVTRSSTAGNAALANQVKHHTDRIAWRFSFGETSACRAATLTTSVSSVSSSPAAAAVVSWCRGSCSSLDEQRMFPSTKSSVQPRSSSWSCYTTQQQQVNNTSSSSHLSDLQRQRAGGSRSRQGCDRTASATEDSPACLRRRRTWCRKRLGSGVARLSAQLMSVGRGKSVSMLDLSSQNKNSNSDGEVVQQSTSSGGSTGRLGSTYCDAAAAADSTVSVGQVRRLARQLDGSSGRCVSQSATSVKSRCEVADVAGDDETLASTAACISHNKRSGSKSVTRKHWSFPTSSSSTTSPSRATQVRASLDSAVTHERVCKDEVSVRVLVGKFEGGHNPPAAQPQRRSTPLPLTATQCDTLPSSVVCRCSRQLVCGLAQLTRRNLTRHVFCRRRSATLSTNTSSPPSSSCPLYSSVSSHTVATSASCTPVFHGSLHEFK